MAEKDMIPMCRREARRLRILHQASDMKITKVEAAGHIGPSDRQLRRMHNGTLYQMEQATRAENVTVEERIDGTVHITYRGHNLRCREVTKKSTPGNPKSPLLLRERTQRIPSPWRKLVLSKRRRWEQAIDAP